MPRWEPQTVEQRFWTKVEKTESCWFWTAAKNQNGYGVFWPGGKPVRNVLAHRFSWQLVKGDVPDGMHVLHRCDTPDCVNPAHLFLGTHGDNMVDMAYKGRQAKGDRVWGKKRERCQRGSRNGMAKLSEDDVAEIRKLAEAGEAGTVIAARYGVHQSQISRILSGRRWKHTEA